MKMVRLAALIIAVALSIGSYAPARAASQRLTFDGVTHNSPVDTANGEAQLFADVACSGSTVSLTFGNSGPAPMSITKIYWDGSGLFTGITSLQGSAGVSFVQDTKKVLPGGNTTGFVVDFMVKADAPTQPNGVNPGESLNVTLALASGKSCTDVQAALRGGSFRIGLHVQGFVGEGSESFVSNPPPNDPTLPVCNSVFFNVNKEQRVLVSDADSGIASIQVVASPTLVVTVAPFTVGTKSPVLVTAVSTDEAVDGVFTIIVTDLSGNTAKCSFDMRRPVCGFASIYRGTPEEPDIIKVYIQDYGLGLERVEVTRADNVNFVLPQFTPGSNERYIITATQIDVTKGWYIETAVFDLAGTIKTCDPVLTVIDAGETEVYTEVPEAERYVVVENSSALPITVEIRVNATLFVISDLQPGATVNLDVVDALTPGLTNTFSLTGIGAPGAWADVAIWDIPPEELP